MSNRAEKLPKKFISRLEGQLSEEDIIAFKEAFDEFAPVSYRTNPFKPAEIDFSDITPVPWCDEAHYIAKRPSFAKDPLIFAGAYYVQEASSMFLWQALKQHAPLEKDIKVLDLCAAPGGKSTLINSLITQKSLLVANEVIDKRATPLIDNLVRWGNPNTIVTANYSDSFTQLREYFDVIVADAPCSGEGMFRKDPKTIDAWSPMLINSCRDIQKEIVDYIPQSLKAGGLFIYSTCTFSPQENEERLEQILDSEEFEPLEIELDPSWGITKIEVEKNGIKATGYRFIFHKTTGEGLFLTAFRKKGEPSRHQKFSVSPKKMKQVFMLRKRESEEMRKWLENGNDFDFYEEEDEIYAIPKNLVQDFKMLYVTQTVRHQGTKMGRLNKKNNQLIPDHELAVSNIIASSIPSTDVEYRDAIDYLKKQDMSIKTIQGVKGWALIKFKGLVLGWVKVLPNRLNNYYPTEHRLVKNV
ncbi:methyltransferase RsmF C-terminal domain-like protein [Flammeovirga kamogawensis]|uniref:SAM-dependent MTase RsmB/NOP-type domain-containing protein n=1 Tax=Flammeovirga kamogawensis TaxID=373891 RepID=A0ABX8GSB7_9BACT|nr:hypothetical protein [Flammeovirga kamogawensis]MBB6461392.1 16S rRNA C967 or C1407 C5-methylase (RsmB/RsmF family) [Flammeovirga kamogawensis]QWG06291.1 hypothetical protein KM029_13215 [Flammeovirga kamogawensis]TRX68120.1 hypothetical protein EO216_08230 [Flammeovirga kamogawensis]